MTGYKSLWSDPSYCTILLNFVYVFRSTHGHTFIQIQVGLVTFHSGNCHPTKLLGETKSFGGLEGKLCVWQAYYKKLHLNPVFKKNRDIEENF